MPFTPKVYQDGAAGGTPILAADLNALENQTAADVTAITAGDVTNPASAAGIALSATIGQLAVPRWVTATNYTAGDKVVSPNGDIVSSIATHTSGVTFNPANWNLSASFALAGAVGSGVQKWAQTTAYTTGTQVIAPNGETVTALSNFTSGTVYSDANWRIGTDPSNAPVAKPSGDTRAGVWEFTHNSGTGYLFHLLAGASFAAPAALIACGIDNGNGSGILLANKAAGIGMTVNQQATISDVGAYGIKITGSTTLAPSLRIEQNVDGAADGLQIVALDTTPTAAQKLAYFGKQGGEAGSIFALDGRIQWKAPIRVLAKDGTTDNFVEVTENSAYPYADPTAYLGQLSKKGLNLYSPNGGGALWRFGIATGGSYMNVSTGVAGAVGAATTYDVIKIQHQKIAFLGSTPQAQKTRVGVYTPAAAPAAYDQTEAAAFRTAVAAKVNALEALMSAAASGFGFTA